MEKKRIGNGQVTFPVPLRLFYREGERRKRKRKKNGFSTVTYFVTFSFVTKYVPLSSLAICDALSRLQTKWTETGPVVSNLRRCCGHRIKQYDQPSHRWLDNHTTFHLQPQSILAARDQLMGGQMPSSCHTYVMCQVQNACVHWWLHSLVWKATGKPKWHIFLWYGITMGWDVTLSLSLYCVFPCLKSKTEEGKP